jgi:putative PEP-CTERM system TPR-repeat lipoprotein
MPRNAKNPTLAAALVSGAILLGAGLGGCQREQSTASLLAEAKQYQQKGDRKAALIQLKNAVANSPDDGEARLALGTHYLDSGDIVSADKELRKAASLGIAPARTLPLLAAAMLAQGQFQKLLDEVTPDKAQGVPELLARRGDALLALHKLDEAKQAYEQALATKGALAEPRLGLARLAMVQSDSAAAQRYADEAAAAEPGNAEVWMFKGALLRAEGKQEEALAAYAQALKAKPNHRSAHVDKAYVEIGLGKFADAAADLEAARKNTPGNLLVTYAQGLLDFSQGKYAAAQESLQKVLRSAPEHMPSILLAGAVELNLGATQQAEQHLRKYLEANPNHVYARKLLAQALLKSAQPGDAVAVLAPALKDPGADAQLLALAGQSYMQVNDFDKASSYFEKASTLAPKAAALHTSLGLSKMAQGDKASAERELELGASLDSASGRAGTTLVAAQMRMKNYDKALAAAQALEKTQPNDPTLHNLKGGIYLAKNDPAAARASFERALAAKPDFFPALANLAQLDLQQKQPERARQRFEAVLAKDKDNLAVMAALAALANGEGKTAEATGWLEKANAARPEAVAPALQLGAQYLASGQQQKALTLARKYQAANGTNPELLDLLARAQLANDDAAGALDSYGKLAALAPKSAAVQVQLAHAHLLLKNEAAANDDLNKALALQPGFLPAQVAQVQLAEQKGNTDAAIAIARQLQKQHPAEPNAFMLEGDLAARHDRTEQALAAYEKAFAVSKSAPVLVKIHQQLVKSGKDEAAAQRLARWQKDNPQDVQVPLYLAERRLAEKDYKGAAAQLQAVLRQSPNNAVALNNLAWAYQQDKDPRALATAEQAYRLAGNSPAVLDTLGWLLLERGDVARALPLLQRAAGLTAEPGIRYHFAVALQKSGDKENARKTLLELLGKGGRFPEAPAARALLREIG